MRRRVETIAHVALSPPSTLAVVEQTRPSGELAILPRDGMPSARAGPASNAAPISDAAPQVADFTIELMCCGFPTELSLASYGL